MAKVTVNTKGLEDKLNLHRTNFEEVFTRVHLDGASYLNDKLASKVINGDPGAAYPTAVAKGVRGYVNRVFGKLRASIGPDFRVTPYQSVIRQRDEGQAPYHKYVVAWSKEKYGLSFYRITANVYGPLVVQIMADWVSEVLKKSNEKKRIKYKNRFPS